MIKTEDSKTLWMIAGCFARHTADVESRERDTEAQIRSFRAFLSEEKERRLARRSSLGSTATYYLLRAGMAAAAGAVFGGLALGVVVLAISSGRFASLVQSLQ